MKRIILTVVLTLGLCFAGCEAEKPCEHIWTEATHFEPKMCQCCGTTEGEPIPHSWVDATCSKPKHCEDCGIEEGITLEHTWKDATCTEAKTCTVCNVTEGTMLGHNCNYYDGSYTGEWHNYRNDGPPVDSVHICEDIYCIDCGEKVIEGVGHFTGAVANAPDIWEYWCIFCNKYVKEKDDIPNVINITKLDIDMDSMGGISAEIKVKNNLDKTVIKYIRFNLSFFNAVQDKLTCRIHNTDNVTIEMIGPILPGETSKNNYWDPFFYNSSYGDYLDINWIEIEFYFEGESYTVRLEDDLAVYTVERFR